MHFCLSTQVDTGKISGDLSRLTQRTQPQFIMRVRKEGQRALLDSSLHPKNSSDLGFFSPQQHSLLGCVIYIEGETIPAFPLIQSKLSAGQNSTLSTHPKDMSMCGGMEQTQISSQHNQVTVGDCNQHPRAPLSCRGYAADTTIIGHFSLP